jgi:uncharacterized protein (DUF1501 family)
MSRITRRRFLAGAGTGAAALAVGTGAAGRWLGAEPVSSARDVSLDPSTSDGDGILVLVTLVGGNDGLNTIIPVDHPVYMAGRGALAVPAASALSLSDGFGLHPTLPNLHREWGAGRLAVVHGVGFDGLDRSHFHCMHIWEQADSNAHHASGWLGRWLDIAAADDPLLGVAIGSTVPPVLRGTRTTGATVQPGGAGIPGGARVAAAVAEMASDAAERTGMAAAVARSNAELLRVLATTRTLETTPPPDAALGTGGQPDLRAQLSAVAELLGAGLSTRVVAVHHDGFDTHARQIGIHERLLTDLDAAVADFLAGLDERVRERVVVAIHSEFGRRVGANANDGTDHGTSGPMLLVGSRVRGGHHGDPPPLDQLVDGDLRHTIDFRRVYGGLLEGVLATPAADIIPGRYAPLPVIG